MTTPEPTAGIVLGEGPLLPEQRAELEEIRAVVATGDSLGSANATWLVAIVDRLDAALAAAREAGREEGRADERERIAQAIEADPGTTTKHFMARNTVYDEDGEPTGEIEEVPDCYTTIHGPEHYARIARTPPDA